MWEKREETDRRKLDISCQLHIALTRKNFTEILDPGAAHDFKFRQPLGTGFSPQDSDKSSPSLFCKAELEELGGSGFRQTS